MATTLALGTLSVLATTSINTIPSTSADSGPSNSESGSGDSTGSLLSRRRLDARLAIFEAAGGSAGIVVVFELNNYNLGRLGLSARFAPYITGTFGNMVAWKVFKNGAILVADRELRDAVLQDHATSFRQELPVGPPVLFHRTEDILYLESLGGLRTFLLQAGLQDLRGKAITRLALGTTCLCGRGPGGSCNIHVTLMNPVLTSNTVALQGICHAIRRFKSLKTLYLVLPSSLGTSHPIGTKAFAEQEVANFMVPWQAIWQAYELLNGRPSPTTWAAPEIIVTTKPLLMGLV